MRRIRSVPNVLTFRSCSYSVGRQRSVISLSVMYVCSLPVSSRTATFRTVSGACGLYTWTVVVSSRTFFSFVHSSVVHNVVVKSCVSAPTSSVDSFSTTGCAFVRCEYVFLLA